jgi:hypothetical protein
VTYKVVFRPQAQAELFEARDWYEERQAGLGVEFSPLSTPQFPILASDH